MRIRIEHATTYSYDRAARFIIQSLRLTPRSCDGQQITRWRIETDVDARLRPSEDAFGNIVHALYTEQPTETLTVRVSGEAETTDTNGVLGGWPERLSPLVFLRSTDLTRCDAALIDFAEEFRDGAVLDRLHRLMGAVHERIAFQVGVTSADHTAAQAFAEGKGVCQDHAHVFIAAARRLGIPARYVSGHMVRLDGLDDQEAAHAWAEAYVEGLGWTGFDAANGVCPTDAYVRVASGLDYLGAAPVRGTSYGGAGERLTVRLNVSDARRAQGRQQAQQAHQARQARQARQAWQAGAPRRS